MKKAMNVTGMIQGPPAGLLEALIKAEKNPHAPAEIQNIRERYDAYRKSWSELRTSIQDATMARSGEERGSFVTWLSSEFGSLSHEPDFHHLAASAGAKALAMRDTAQEQAIALEGLRELSGEYAPDAPTPETADDIVQFLTRVRAVLDAFFKAYLPLRDGQRELEKELGIRSSVTSTDAIEIADSPQALAAALLGPWDEGEQPIELVESTLADVMIHHIAMLNGVMNGAKHILAEISPDAVRAAAANLQKRGVLSRGFGGGYKVLWQAFERCHADLAEEEKQLFALLFGRQFHQAFAQQQEILRSRG
jgi:type VI secretion system protein ImpI